MNFAIVLEENYVFSISKENLWSKDMKILNHITTIHNTNYVCSTAIWKLLHESQALLKYNFEYSNNEKWKMSEMKGGRKWGSTMVGNDWEYAKLI